jgi:hypothetical protein
MNRFHSKFHRKNHHTSVDTNNPDAGHDPIASPTAPFQGGFFLNGSLSASGTLTVSAICPLSGTWAGAAVLGTNGTVNVRTSFVTASSLIFLTNQFPSGTVGTPYIQTVDARNTTFTIASTQTADRSKIGWLIIEPKL